jgi:hypothetical protein
MVARAEDPFDILANEDAAEYDNAATHPTKKQRQSIILQGESKQGSVVLCCPGKTFAVAEFTLGAFMQCCTCM